ncbi:hypothetical protein [Aquitalea magnusonii]|uniref:Phage tail protein n=1 Tax=Aquitalea magnusonii TaxID=332411 RepID=A0A318J390_9NEIS|nr:hypothetical protein [Aquitalea magnusonii]PXX42207.1 hypothetical protein DFR38_1204 [Aquitalea magnusonii]
MNDLYHFIGGDLSTSPTGDLMPVTGVDKGRQRILRRLMTNPGDYIHHPDYGAGLGRFVGDVVDVPGITALIRSQLAMEAAVARKPAAQVDVTPINNGVSVQISYIDAPTGTPAVLAFDVNR